MAAITDYLAEIDAAANDEDLQSGILNDGLEVWVNGLLWSLSLEEAGWQAWPVRGTEAKAGEAEDDGSEGEPRRIGGSELTRRRSSNSCVGRIGTKTSRI